MKHCFVYLVFMKIANHIMLISAFCVMWYAWVMVFSVFWVYGLLSFITVFTYCIVMDKQILVVVISIYQGNLRAFKLQFRAFWVCETKKRRKKKCWQVPFKKSFTQVNCKQIFWTWLQLELMFCRIKCFVGHSENNYQPNMCSWLAKFHCPLVG